MIYEDNLYDGDEDAPCLCGAWRCGGSLYSVTHLRKLTKKRAKGRRLRPLPLDLIGPLVKPGVTTGENLDRFVFEFARDHGAYRRR